MTGPEGGSPTAGAAPRVVSRATALGLSVCTAESLTGGLLVARLVDVPGASACVAGGAVCYSYDAKAALLGVDRAMLEADGAVTPATARAMARGALEAYGADLAIATTGVAGPGPDERGVPAGTVVLACARRRADGAVLDVAVRELRLDGDRAAVRAGSVEAALALLEEALGSASSEVGGPERA
ncbi:CinA family protein [Brachybacterium huguangmaarense]